MKEHRVRSYVEVRCGCSMGRHRRCRKELARLVPGDGKWDLQLSGWRDATGTGLKDKILVRCPKHGDLRPFTVEQVLGSRGITERGKAREILITRAGIA